MTESSTPDSAGPLPFVDEHRISIAATPDVVWDALVDQLAGLGKTPLAPYAHLVGTDPRRTAGDFPELAATLPGFAVSEVDPEHRLVLTGRHHFSRYALSFVLTRRARGTDLAAHTYAEFPGPWGQVYRGLVIGSRGHVLLLRRLLRSVRRRAE